MASYSKCVTFEFQEIWKIEQGIKNLKLLVLHNKHWGITLVKGTDDYTPSVDSSIPLDKIALLSDLLTDVKILFIYPNPNIPWSCHFVKFFYNVILVVATVGLSKY